jgi:cell division septum initiation protein DivIVA
VSDIEHELIATLWDLKVAKDRIDKLTKSNLQLREGCEELKQRIKRLEAAGDEVVINYVTSMVAFEIWRKAKEAKP